MDDEHDALLLDEDKVVDALDPILADGGVVVDYHGSDFFPVRFFDAVLVLTTDTAVLWDRLDARGYAEAKIRENVQCEIMRVCADEAEGAGAGIRIPGHLALPLRVEQVLVGLWHVRL